MGSTVPGWRLGSRQTLAVVVDEQTEMIRSDSGTLTRGGTDEQRRRNRANCWQKMEEREQQLQDETIAPTRTRTTPADMTKSVHKESCHSKFPKKSRQVKSLNFTRRITGVRRTTGTRRRWGRRKWPASTLANYRLTDSIILVP